MLLYGVLAALISSYRGWHGQILALVPPDVNGITQTTRKAACEGPAASSACQGWRWRPAALDWGAVQSAISGGRRPALLVRVDALDRFFSMWGAMISVDVYETALQVPFAQGGNGLVDRAQTQRRASWAHGAGSPLGNGRPDQRTRGRICIRLQIGISSLSRISRA